MNIGNEIKTKRKALNMTQVELADKCQVTNKSISRWEKGSTIPDIYSLKKLSSILGIDINSFFNELEVVTDETLIDYHAIKRFVIVTTISLSMLVLSLLIVSFIQSFQDAISESLEILLFILFIAAFFSFFGSIVNYVIGYINFRFSFLTKKTKRNIIKHY